ncbi:MAG TPA: dihydrofolate reductase family protein, partial [Candidatus Sulfotelmatobacter sp.]|nr:dihydrofolate reductase family protein [Candidatus Sulfotelmatobacter sp.]
GTPLVTLKAAMTLDGKIAPPPTETLLKGNGTPAGGWVTSEVARAHVQELRHQNDALMVGAGTILSDNPLLTDRSGKRRRRPLLRVILDSRLRLPLDSRLVKNVAAERANDVLVFCSSADEKKKAELEKVGVRVEIIPTIETDGRPDLPAILRRLGQLEIISLMIEGGATVNWAALAANVVHKVFLYYAPKILAGTGSVSFAAGAGFRHMSQAAQVKHLHLHRFGEDFAVEGYVRDPYGE